MRHDDHDHDHDQRADHNLRLQHDDSGADDSGAELRRRLRLDLPSQRLRRIGLGFDWRRMRLSLPVSRADNAGRAVFERTHCMRQHDDDSADIAAELFWHL